MILITECTKKQTIDLNLRIKQLQDQLDAQQRNNPVTKTATSISKNFRGSSNLIWNKNHPSRNLTNRAPAVNQRFQNMTPRPNTQIRQESTMTRTPQLTINQSTPIVRAQTIKSPTVQLQIEDSMVTPNVAYAPHANASNEPIRKQEWNRSKNKRRKS